VTQEKKNKKGLTDRNLEKQLKSYALAAATAGVGLMAMSDQAAAAVVYTPTQITLIDGQTAIDLNNDGVTDFTLIDRVKFKTSYSNRALGVMGATGNEVVKGQGKGAAAALLQNAPISSGQAFLPVDKARGRMASVGYNCITSNNCPSFAIGPFKQVKNEYLGFKFTFNGETHFGWARLNVKYLISKGGNSSIQVYLSGYAYESTPNMEIGAGQVTGAEAQGSLGQLARGTAK
jgi:hypothetical protein